MIRGRSINFYDEILFSRVTKDRATKPSGPIRRRVIASAKNDLHIIIITSNNAIQHITVSTIHTVHLKVLSWRRCFFSGILFYRYLCVLTVFYCPSFHFTNTKNSSQFSQKKAREKLRNEFRNDAAKISISTCISIPGYNCG